MQKYENTGLGSFGVPLRQNEGPGVERAEQQKKDEVPEAALAPHRGRQREDFEMDTWTQTNDRRP